MLLPRDKSKIDLQNKRTPELVLDFQCEKGVLFIVLENIGLASAYAISVKFDKKISGNKGRNIGAMNIFNCLEFMPAGKRFQIFIDSFHSYITNKQPLVVEATIVYSNKRGRQCKEIIKHNLSIFKDIQEVVI